MTGEGSYVYVINTDIKQVYTERFQNANVNSQSFINKDISINLDHTYTTSTS